MPDLDPQQIPTLASALIRLRGETLGRIAAATGIRTANLSVWLRGKEQVISSKRQISLLHHLGVEGGRLRTDELHLWHDHGALDDSKTILTTLLTNNRPMWLFQDAQSELPKTRFLLAGNALIRIEITPGINQAADLGGVINADRVITIPRGLKSVPTTSLTSARSALLDLAQYSSSNKELLDELMPCLRETITDKAFYPSDWQQLEQALRSAFTSGAQPSDIARVIDAHYKNR